MVITDEERGRMYRIEKRAEKIVNALKEEKFTYEETGRGQQYFINKFLGS